MGALLAQLNGGGSFGGFVRCMRREFQALVEAEAAAAQQGQPAPPGGEPLAAC